MYDELVGKKHTILVATEMEDREKSLFQIAEQLARKTGMTLQFTHVRETVPSEYMLPHLFGDPTPFHLVQDFEKQMQEKAEQKLQALTDSLKDKLPLTTKILTNNSPAYALLKEASRINASLILCEVADESLRFFSRNFSTSLRLMASSSVPVMVVSGRCKKDFSKVPLKFLVADDLLEGSRAALDFACEMSMTWPNVEFHHLHIHELSKKNLHDFAECILGSITGQNLEKVDLIASDILRKETDVIKNKLSHRLGQIRDLFERQGTKYLQHVGLGDVCEQLMQFAKSIDADMVIFGRHHMIHAHPFGIGRMPFHAMLHLNCPVVIAPD